MDRKPLETDHKVRLESVFQDKHVFEVVLYVWLVERSKKWVGWPQRSNRVTRGGELLALPLTTVTLPYQNFLPTFSETA